MNNLFQRTLAGAAYVLFMVSAITLHPYLFFFAFAAIQFVLLREFSRIVRSVGFTFVFYMNFLLGLLLFSILFSVASGWIHFYFILIMVPAFLLLFIIEIFRQKENPLGNVAASCLAFLYISVPLGLLNFLIFPGFPENTGFDPSLLLGVCIILWTYDTGAYLIGSRWGKHKLMKEISPKKSWEGVIGGAIFSLTASALLAVLFQAPGLVTWIGIALITVLAGTLGDLFESLLKRNAGIKDTGTLLPGHGGLLDRFDSLLFVVAPVFIWLLLAGNP